MKTKPSDAGKALYEFSRTNDGKGKVSSALFPYVYLASKTLSTRAISEFLEKEKGLKISHSTIANAIKTADEYFEVLTRRISACVQDWIDYAHPCFSDRDMHCVEVLFDEPSMLNTLLTDKPSLEYMFETGIDVRSAVQVIQSEWVPLPDEFKMDCLPYFMRLLNEKMSQNENQESQQ